jgi:hypothetical protein
MKSPPVQYRDEEARRLVEEFVAGGEFPREVRRIAKVNG